MCYLGFKETKKIFDLPDNCVQSLAMFLAETISSEMDKEAQLSSSRAESPRAFTASNLLADGASTGWGETFWREAQVFFTKSPIDPKMRNGPYFQGLHTGQ